MFDACMLNFITETISMCSTKNYNKSNNKIYHFVVCTGKYEWLTQRISMPMSNALTLIKLFGV